MADVMVMKEIEDTALRLGVDLSTLDLDSIRLPPGETCGIVRSLFRVFHFILILATEQKP